VKTRCLATSVTGGAARGFAASIRSSAILQIGHSLAVEEVTSGCMGQL